MYKGVHYKDWSKNKGDLRIIRAFLRVYKDLHSIDFKYSDSSLWTGGLELSKVIIYILIKEYIYSLI